jgi:hypothetical protein
MAEEAKRMAEEAKSGTLNCGNCNYSDEGGKKTLNCEGCDLSLKKDSGSASSSSDDKKNLAIAYFFLDREHILVKNQYLKYKPYEDDNVFAVFKKFGGSETEYQVVQAASNEEINNLLKDQKLTTLQIQDDFVMVGNNRTDIAVNTTRGNTTRGGSRKPKRKTKKRKTKKRKTKRRTNKKRYRHL